MTDSAQFTFKTSSVGDEQEEVVAPAKVPIFALKRKIENMASLIFQALGPGSKEKVYQKALEQLLHDEGFVCMSEKAVPIYFRDEPVAVGYADIIVQGRLVLELKATSGSIQVAHINQCRQYMRALRIEQGMVINFPQHQALGSNVEIYDCQLAGNFATTKISTEDRARVDSGEYGPAPRRSGSRNILSYVDYQRDYEKDLPPPPAQSDADSEDESYVSAKRITRSMKEARRRRHHHQSDDDVAVLPRLKIQTETCDGKTTSTVFTL